MSALETLDVGQANELKLAFRRCGFSNEEVKHLSEGNILADVRRVLLGHAEIKIKEHVIDCDVNPMIPDGWTIEEHTKGGQLKWDPAKATLFLTDAQKNGVIEGNELRKELAKEPVLNACVLDYLLAHPHLIPDSWKVHEQGRTRFIYFWGTIYRGSDGNLCVRCLCWNDGRWSSYFRWLGRVWDDQNPAVLRAMPTGPLR